MALRRTLLTSSWYRLLPALGPSACETQDFSFRDGNLHVGGCSSSCSRRSFSAGYRWSFPTYETSKVRAYSSSAKDERKAWLVNKLKEMIRKKTRDTRSWDNQGPEIAKMIVELLEEIFGRDELEKGHASGQSITELVERIISQLKEALECDSASPDELAIEIAELFDEFYREEDKLGIIISLLNDILLKETLTSDLQIIGLHGNFWSQAQSLHLSRARRIQGEDIIRLLHQIVDILQQKQDIHQQKQDIHQQKQGGSALIALERTTVGRKPLWTYDRVMALIKTCVALARKRHPDNEYIFVLESTIQNHSDEDFKLALERTRKFSSDTKEFIKATCVRAKASCVRAKEKLKMILARLLQFRSMRDAMCFGFLLILMICLEEYADDIIKLFS